MIYLKDILNKPYPLIMARTNSPFPEDEDELFGYCSWDGKELISLDGDNYYLDQPIYNWEYDESNNMLIYWFKVDWI